MWGTGCEGGWACECARARAFGGWSPDTVGEPASARARTHDDLVARLLHVGHLHNVRAAIGGDERGGVDHRLELRTGEARRRAREQRRVDVAAHDDLAQVVVDDGLAAAHVGQRNVNRRVEAARTHECGVENLWRVRRRDNDDILVLREAVQRREKLVQRLPLGARTSDSHLALAAQRVDLIDEDNRGRVLARGGKEVTNAPRAEADKHFLELRRRLVVKLAASFAGDSAREQRLACARRARQQHAARHLSAQTAVLLRIAQEVDDVLELGFGFVRALYIREARRRDVRHLLH